MLGDINWGLKIIKPQIFLCSPNGVAIAKLKDIYNINQVTRVGKLNEVSFTLPYMVERKNQTVRNPDIDKVRERFLLKIKLGSKEEFYMINSIKKEGSNIEVKQVHAFGLGHELRDKTFRLYKKDAITAVNALADALSESIWAIGAVDVKFITTYRSFDITSMTALDFVFKIAETYKGILEWDTVNRKINLLDPETVGQNKGLKIKYGKYLKSIGQEISTDNLITRLHIYGKENLSIHRVNPTGQSFLDNFSHFIYPFYREIYDSNNPEHLDKPQHTNMNTNEVYVNIQSSNYMTDGLCNAILDYNDLVESRTGEFQGYVADKETLQETLTTKENEMSTLQTEMAIIEDELVVAKSTEQDTTLLDQQKADKQAEIDAKQAEIDQVNSDIADVDTNINSLREDLAVENNFTAAQSDERNQFIIESTWSDENYFDDQTLYNDAFDVFEKFNTPQIIIDTDIVNFLEVVEEQRNWDKLVLGDIITIEHEMLGIEVEAKIIEIEYDYGNSSIRLVIANVKEILTKEEQFYRDLYNFTSTSTTVDVNKYKFDIVEQTSSEFEAYKNAAIDATRQMIIAGTNESVEISRRGILIKNPDDPASFIIQNHSVIALTKDYGNTWDTAISAHGIHAPVIIGDLLVSSELRILNQSGKFTFDENGATLIDADITLTKTGGKSKVIINADNGFKIQKKIGTSFVDKLYTDSNGTLVAEDLIAKSLKITDGSNAVLIDATTKTIDFSKFNTILGTMSADHIYGGELTLGGTNNQNGKMLILDANGETIADLDAGNGGFEWLRIGDVISDSVVKTNIDSYSLYVNTSNGDDISGNGSSGSPYKTLQKAINAIPKYNEGTITIYMTGNTTETIEISGFVGSGIIEFKLQNYQINGYINVHSNLNRIILNDTTINVANTTYAGVHVLKTKIIDAINVKIYGRNVCDFGFSVNDASFLQAINSEIYDVVSVCIRAAQGSIVYVENCEGLSNYGLQADSVGTIGGRGTAPSGNSSNTRTYDGGEIRSSFTYGSGAATPPPPPDTTKTWTSSSVDNWSSSGYWGGDGAKQGNWGYGRRTGYWFFGSSPSSTVTGKNIKRMRVYVKRENAGGYSSDVTVYLRWHTYTSRPGSAGNMAGMGSEYKAVNLRWGESAWVELPSSFYNDFESGNAKGIGIYVTSDSRSSYASMLGQAKLEITYA